MDPRGLDEHQRGQNTWPPVGSFVGHQRAANWPPTGSFSWPPSLGDVEVLDLIMHTEITEDGDWPNLTVYFVERRDHEDS